MFLYFRSVAYFVATEAFYSGIVRSKPGLGYYEFRLMLFGFGYATYNRSITVYALISRKHVCGIERSVINFTCYVFGFISLVFDSDNSAFGIVLYVPGTMMYAIKTVPVVNRFVHYVFNTI
jgi:hypothetical protein